MEKHPLVIAYHLIWTAYGWWLPNDPRGSGSKSVACDVIAELGELHHGRKKIQPAGQAVREFYERAATILKFPLLTFDEAARAVIGEAFGKVIEQQRYRCYACAIMPDHVHIVIRKHKHSAEQMLQALKDNSRLRLSTAGLRSADHPVWTGGHGWVVFLDHPNEIRRTIPYVEKNPLKIGLPTQRWPFVTLYDGWPLHPGHSPNSPYARRLRELGRFP
ncbi:MAG TPA: transposase [Gemmataceae bacterium]|jgi:REP element-mobilizing transposase RayT|nr:transposase [Gemmataceae bacterium]